MDAPLPDRHLSEDLNHSHSLNLPRAPGDWLRLFREQRATAEGELLTREELGRRMGVSARTIRRWEGGEFEPVAADLHRLTSVLALSPVQRDYLYRAYSKPQLEYVSDTALFRRNARLLLSSEFPAVLLDELFYVVAWNSYITALSPSAAAAIRRRGAHMLDVVIESRSPKESETAIRSRMIRQRYWVKTLWLETAAFWRKPAYQAMLGHLSRLPGFSEYWLALVSGDDLDPTPVNAPYLASAEEMGAFRVFAAPLRIPGTHHLREYVPLDSTALARVAALRAMGPPKPFFADGA